MSAVFYALVGLGISLSGIQPLEHGPYRSSVQGNYQFRTEHSRDGVGETPVSSFTLYDRELKSLVRLERPGVDDFLVSDEGWFVGIISVPGLRRIDFYDRAGNVVARQPMAGPANYAFSRSGRRLFVNSQDGLAAYDARGQVVARYGHGSWFAVSDDEERVALVQDDMLMVYRAAGGKPEVRIRLASPLFRHLAFSADGQLLAVVERSTVSLYLLSSGELFWQDRLSEPTSLLGVAVGNDGSVYVIGEDDGKGEAGFMALYRHGTVVSRTAIPYVARNEGLTGVTVSADGVQVFTSDRRFDFREER